MWAIHYVPELSKETECPTLGEYRVHITVMTGKESLMPGLSVWSLCPGEAEADVEQPAAEQPSAMCKEQ